MFTYYSFLHPPMNCIRFCCCRGGSAPSKVLVCTWTGIQLHTSSSLQTISHVPVKDWRINADVFLLPGNCLLLSLPISYLQWLFIYSNFKCVQPFSRTGKGPLRIKGIFSLVQKVHGWSENWLPSPITGYLSIYLHSLGLLWS